MTQSLHHTVNIRRLSVYMHALVFVALLSASHGAGPDVGAFGLPRMLTSKTSKAPGSMYERVTPAPMVLIHPSMASLEAVGHHSSHDDGLQHEIPRAASDRSPTAVRKPVKMQTFELVSDLTPHSNAAHSGGHDSLMQTRFDPEMVKNAWYVTTNMRQPPAGFVNVAAREDTQDIADTSEAVRDNQEILSTLKSVQTMISDSRNRDLNAMYIRSRIHSTTC